MNGLSLFSGTAIGEVVFKTIFPGYRTIGYVEVDQYCRSVIRARIRDGILDDAPIFDDIREFNRRYASLYTGKVDWLSGGFPCQPFSISGRRLGEADERNLWPETRDAISIIRPRYAFLENVRGLLANRYFGQILGDLAESGYDCEWDVIGASDVRAPHRRKRIWVLAKASVGTGVDAEWHSLGQAGWNQSQYVSHSSSNGVANPQEQSERAGLCASEPTRERRRRFGNGSGQGEAVPDPKRERLEGEPQGGAETGAINRSRNGGDSGWWSVEPDVGRVVNGMAYFLDLFRTVRYGAVR